MVTRINHPCLSFPRKYQLRFQLVTWSSLHFWSLVDFLSFHLPGLAHWYEKAIQHSYFKEYELFEDVLQPSVLHIGCGSYPLTDITLSRLKKIGHIMGIDNDEESVQRARRIIASKELEKKVTINQGDGTDYNLKKFDIIIVSSCSWPKVFILDHLFTNAKPGCLFIIRELDLAVKPVLKCIQRHKDLCIEQCLQHHPLPFMHPFGWQTFFLRKKKRKL